MSRLQQGILVGFVLSLLTVWLIVLNVSAERRLHWRRRFEEFRKALVGVEPWKPSALQAMTNLRETSTQKNEQEVIFED